MMSHWYLECFTKDRDSTKRIPLDRFPFVVGRYSDLPLSLESPDVSRRHAEFIFDKVLFLRDLGSSNGTYVNRQKISDFQELHHGDIMHFANMEFRLIHEEFQEGFDLDATQFGISELSSLLPEGLQELQELLDKSLTTAELEVIVNSHDHSLFGYEILGRGTHPQLPQKPIPLFHIAESGGMAVKLSEMLRDRGVEIAEKFALDLPFFVNTHPRELDDPERMIRSIFRLRKRFPSMKLVLEIHEEAVTNPDTMLDLKRRLQSEGIMLAYDDFGSGQARLLELVQAPPEFLKFDISLIDCIDKASPLHLHMVETLVKLCRESKIMSLAEGVHSAGLAEICRNIGFDLLQGYFFPFQFPGR